MHKRGMDERWRSKIPWMCFTSKPSALLFSTRNGRGYRYRSGNNAIMAFESQGAFFMRTGRRFTTSSPGTGCKPVGRTWTNRNANGKPQLSYACGRHTPLSLPGAHKTCFTIGCFITSLCRSLRNLGTLFVHQMRVWRISYVRVSLSWSRACSSFSPSPLIELDS